MPAIISGIVFDDLNSNGIFNTGEPGIPNAFLVLSDPSGNCTQLQSDSNGNYSFTGITVAGTYTVYETVATPDACPPTIFTQPSGFNESTTLRKLSVTVTATQITNNTTISGNNFGHDDLQAFGCQSFAYQVQSSPTILTKIDLQTGGTNNVGTLNPSGTLGGTGYNPTDGNLWGYNTTNNRVSRITADRTMTALPAVPNLPAQGYNCGDVDENGYLYLYLVSATIFYVVDVNPNRSTYGKLVRPSNSFQEITSAPFGTTLSLALPSADWSFNPQDGQIYCVNNNTNQVLKVNPITGAVSTITTTPTGALAFGATFFDNHNNLYGIENSTGRVYKFTITGTTATRTLFSQSVAAGTNDGARCATAPIEFANIDPVKSATPFASIGDTITYTINLTNNGNTTASNVILVDTIPNGTSFNTGTVRLDGVTIPTGDPSPPSGVNLGSLGVGAHTLTFTVRVNEIPSPNPIPNIASGTYQFVDGTYPDVFTDGLNTNVATTTVTYAALSAVKSSNISYADIGSTINYTVVLTNTGNTTALNIVFIDTIPNSTSFVNNSLKQGTIAVSGNPNPPGVILPNPIASGGVSTITFSVTVTTIPTINPIPNNATTNFNYLSNTSSLIPGGANSNTVNVLVNRATLQNITKFVDKSFATCGEQITYTIVVPNTGNVTALNVTFKDTIPNGTTFVTNSVYINGNQQLGANPGTGISVPNIAPGSTTTITFSVQVIC